MSATVATGPAARRQPTRKHWIHIDNGSDANAIPAVELSRAANLPLIVAELLLARGVRTTEDVDRFLNPQLAHLHDPYLMSGMRIAVPRVQTAIQNHEPILIYGDYDVDGTTATVLLKTAIEMLGGEVRFHVPHRLKEGYGMRDEILETAATEGVRLVISVDTGIRAFAAARAAKALGLDLIVTDHHLPEIDPVSGTNVPHALAVLNPNHPDCTYPCKHLCGAGVAFKLAQALLETHDAERARTKILPSFLKILAIATVADAVPLLGENRAFVALGLDGLRRPVNAGLRELMKAANLDPSQRKLTPVDIAFRLAPRINAAGRMDIASDVVELFTTRQPQRAQQLAEKLERLNTDRRETEAGILTQIEERLKDPAFEQARCIVMDGAGWHRGIIGILASRIVDQTGKPALVITHEEDVCINNGVILSGASQSEAESKDLLLSVDQQENGCPILTKSGWESKNSNEASNRALNESRVGTAHGSGRSIPNFHLLNAIETCHDLFTRYGGHAHAVGFSLPSSAVPELRQRLETYALANLTEEDLGSPLTIHANLPLDRITPALFTWLRRMEPCGMGNEEPIFAAQNVRVALPPRFILDRQGNAKHVRLQLAQGPRAITFPAIGWHWAERIRSMNIEQNSILHLAYKLRENDHPEFGGLELEICDIALAHA
ncbi:single-stranded-DNA-specific exonuclease RecJ [Alloacidobacterium dinghuense]|uniref:single-stranded-DNA-specific exonuclease RecJ n=1 Tax=Alloacidobacterium dinghuense TaxID=2763107 RepID=UPI00203739D1|nr:DHH family phosphoesterase [Alloacidobacterium dinghuense]